MSEENVEVIRAAATRRNRFPCDATWCFSSKPVLLVSRGCESAVWPGRCFSLLVLSGSERVRAGTIAQRREW